MGEYFPTGDKFTQALRLKGKTRGDEAPLLVGNAQVIVFGARFGS
jgi:hypothetical protein